MQRRRGQRSGYVRIDEVATWVIEKLRDISTLLVRLSNKIHAHKYMGSYRIPDRIAHPFDRVPLTTKRRVEVEKQMYEPDPEAGRRNVHQPVE